MKKTLFTMAALCLSMTCAFSQNQKPKHAKLHPAIIKATPGQSAFDGKNLLRTNLEMTEQDEWKVKGFDTDHLGFQHQKFQQFYQGVKVEGGTYTVHSKGGEVKSMTGSFRTVADLNTSPSLSERKGFENALAHVGASEYAWQEGNSLGYTDLEVPTGELVVFTSPSGDFPARLAYKYDVYASEPLYRAYVFIDAHTGKFIDDYQRIHDTNVPATGNSLYNGNVSITADDTGSNYRLRQTAAGQGVETYDLSNGTNYGSASDVTSSTSNFTSDNTAVQAHWGAEQTHSYYLTKHGRNSYNGSGGKLISYVHYSNNYVNAFWDGVRMTYGDGDGVNYGPLVSLDICAHELTHGVTEYTAGLIYQNESGALNESFSDIFGEATESYSTNGNNDWLMGEQIGAGGSGGAIRSMSNPNAFGDPDTYGGTNWYTGTGDNGGVHINSGVQNKWFYILSVGESGTNDLGNSYAVTGIGIDMAAEVAYRNLSVYLNSGSNYAAARAGAIQAAIDLYGAGSNEEIQVTNAWYAVGVGAAYQPPIGCVEATVDLSITLDNYPSETSWTLTSGGSTIASGSGYSTQGGSVNQTFNLADGDYIFTINDSYGDGICCGYGQGSYSLTSNGLTIVSGGAFGSSASTDFCVQSSGGGPDTQAPTTPGNLTASNTTQTATDLNWSASSDNVGVTGYNIYVDGALDGSSANTSYAVSGLTANTTYNMTVTALDAAGNESAPASVSVTTLPNNPGDTQAPTTPGNLTASNTTQTATDLNWSASSDNVGVTGYNVYVDGALDGSSASTSYAVSGLTANTTYTMSVTASDAAGNESGSASVSVTTLPNGGGGCTGSTVLSYSDFESGWQGWVDGGSDCYRYNGSRSWEGSRSIRIRDNSGTASSMTRGGYDLSSYDAVDVEFYFYPNSMENNEDFWVRYNDGSGWTTVASYARGSSFENNAFYTATVTLSAAQYNLASNAQFRFQCDASGNADRIYIDAVTITGVCNGNFMATTSGQTIKQLTTSEVTGQNGFLPLDTVEGINVFPNPTSGELNLQTEMEIQTVRIFSLNGALVQTVNTFERGYALDVSDLQAGFYLLSIETTDGEVVNKKFVKE